MTRALHTWNRVAAAVAGLGIVALGVAMILWRADVLLSDAALHTASVARVIGSDWWPWAAGVAGVIVVLLGIRWFVAYLPRPAATDLALSPSDESGHLSVSLTALASAMDDRLAAVPGVGRCTSSVRKDRGVRFVETRVHADRGLPLGMLSTVVDDVGRDVEAMLQGDPVATRVLVSVSRWRRETSLRVDSPGTSPSRPDDSSSQRM